MTPLDLRIGNTEFLQSYWEEIPRMAKALGMEPAAELKLDCAASMSYCKEDGGKAYLKHQIRRIHALVGNTVDLDDYNIVITNGATQGLIGLLNRLKYRGQITRVHARAPYYFRFPMMAEAAGVEWASNPPHTFEFLCEIVTLPSNPDNVRYKPLPPDALNTRIQIHDLCYNWPTYGRIEKADYDIMVFGLAKATGHADSRIGWVLINKNKFPGLAADLIWYTELMTGGVSCDAQYRAAKILEHQADIIEHRKRSGCDYLFADTVFHRGMDILSVRWNKIKAAKLLVEPKNDFGMFLWGHCPNFDKVNDQKILYVNGLACGGGERDIRINVGCSEEKFDEFLKRMTQSV